MVLFVNSSGATEVEEKTLLNNRAPSLHQQYFTTTSTNFIAGLPVDISTVAVSSPVARALGSKDLKPEKSFNLSGGFTANPVSGLTLTVDYYNIRINDRIVLDREPRRGGQRYGGGQCRGQGRARCQRVQLGRRGAARLRCTSSTSPPPRPTSSPACRSISRRSRSAARHRQLASEPARGRCARDSGRGHSVQRFHGDGRCAARRARGAGHPEARERPRRCGRIALPPQPTGAMPKDVCGPGGSHKDECLRTIPPRENGGNMDVKQMVVGTTLLLPSS